MSLQGDTDIEAGSVDTDYVQLDDLFGDARTSLDSQHEFSNEFVDDFVALFKEIIEPVDKEVVRTESTGNILHVLVDVLERKRDVNLDGVDRLTRHLVRSSPDMLKDNNYEDNRNPLYKALSGIRPHLKNEPALLKLVNAIVTMDDAAYGPKHYRKCLDAALRMQGKQESEKKTSLHLAFEKKLDSRMLKLLIQAASNETLAIQDGLGRTPMHYAVGFTECDDARVEIIELLVQRDLKVLQNSATHGKQFLDVFDNEGLSVYREHEISRVRGIKSEEVAPRKKRVWDRHRGLKATHNDPSMPKVDKGASKPQDTSKTTRDMPQVGGRGPTARGGGGDEMEELERARRDKRNKESELKKQTEPPRKQPDPARVKEALTNGDRRGDRRRDEADIIRKSERDVSVQARGRPDNPEKLCVDLGHLKSHVGSEHSPNTPIKRSATIKLEGREKPRETSVSRKQHDTRSHAPDKLDAERKANLERKKANSQKILTMLKLHYMRTRDAELAIAFLYGSNIEDKLISFEYDKLPSSMSWDKFRDRFGKDTKSGLKFDEVLQYVTFPQVRVANRVGRLASKRETIEMPYERLGGQGRQDMTYFFNWLHDKGVRHIIRVSVDDSGPEIHSDEAIQTSLERFVIEELDWQKLDLDPQTILHVSSKAQEKKVQSEGDPQGAVFLPDRQLKVIILRWSGSNAVLRGWSEAEGLRLLPKLAAIHLYPPRAEHMSDGQLWIENKVAEFRARLNEGRAEGEQVKVVCEDALDNTTNKGSSEGGPRLSSTSVAGQGSNPHRWLRSSDNFATVMTQWWSELPRKSGEDIVVALIDDGVDAFDQSFSNQVLEGKSFDFHNNKVRPPYSSARGHGTVMASMILRMCPMAKIYPIRLRTFGQDGNRSNSINIKYVGQAIQAALDKKAAIISMSWTLPLTNDNSESKQALHTAIEEAIKQDKLMFCSAPDGGKFTDMDYPSGPWRDQAKFFRIGAAKPDGTVFDWTPDDITFVLPGVDVVKDQFSNEMHPGERTTRRVKEVQYETGSSVATALAAGLAAMILHCVRTAMELQVTHGAKDPAAVGLPITPTDLQRLAKPEGMRYAFRQLGKLTGYQFIEVWEKLDPASGNIELAMRRDESGIDGFRKFASLLISRDNVV